jgi:hypothetical protein
MSELSGWRRILQRGFAAFADTDARGGAPKAETFIAIGPRATRECRRRQPSLSATGPTRLREHEQSRFEQVQSGQLRPEDAASHQLHRAT